jgi:GNAT superfamily N-acetyltransferase
MTWTLYRHFKGNNYLGFGTALDSELKTPVEVYRCLYENDLAKNWVRPLEMFEGRNEQGQARFESVARMRVVQPEDEATVLAFGYDAWGEGKPLSEFLASYEKSRNHFRGISSILPVASSRFPVDKAAVSRATKPYSNIRCGCEASENAVYGEYRRCTFRGTRYLLELLDGTIVCNLNTLRFKRGLLGIASVSTAPAFRGRGYARLLLKAVMELQKFHEGEDLRFLLFSEVNPEIYESCGFYVLGKEHQRFTPSIAMASGSSPLTKEEGEFLKAYF